MSYAIKKIQKFLIIFSIISFNCINAKSQISGYGCLVGSTVYTEYLGEASPYHPSNPPTKFYRSNGNSVALNYNNYSNSKPNNYNYECNKINVFGASSGGPAQQEFTKQGSSCVTSTSLGGPIAGNGDYVFYSYNKPAYCSSPTVPVPIDDYILPILVCVSVVAFYHISKKSILLS
jgi:hypothetical protein